MKKLVIGTIAALLIIAVVASGIYLQRRQHIKRQLLMAEAAISTVIDYGMSSAVGQADLAARNQLDALDTEDLNAEEANAASALRDYLAGIEGIINSQSIETTELRSKLIQPVAKKADEAMAPFHKK